MENRLIKAVLFDIDNTLLNFTACSKTAMEQAIKEYGYDSLPELYPTFRRINDALWTKIERHELTRAEHKKIRWKMIFGELNLDLNGQEFEATYHKYFDSIGIKIDGAEDILEYLYGKYPLYIASNADQAIQVCRLENAGLIKYFEDVFTSERVGAMKPNKGFFEGCFKLLPEGLKPEEVLFVGDSLEADMTGGINYGLKTCWFNFPKRDIPIDLKPDYIIDDLAELKKIL